MTQKAVFCLDLNFFARTLDKSKKAVHNSNPSLLTEQDSSLKIRIQRTDKCEHRQFRELSKHSKKTYECSRFEGKAERRKLILSLSIPAKSDKTEIELKSLILAQIERWRHALHMQVERQHKELAPGWRVAHG